MQIFTTKGMIDDSLLVKKYIETKRPPCVIELAREYYLGEELVKRDCWVAWMGDAESFLEAQKGAVNNGN